MPSSSTAARVAALALAAAVPASGRAASALLAASGLSQPAAAFHVPGPGGTPGTLWVADGDLGLCPVVEPPDAATPSLPDLARCVPLAGPAGAVHAGQVAFDGAYAYVPDLGAPPPATPASQGVLRARYDAATETFAALEPLATLAAPAVAALRPSAVAVGPGGALLVAYLESDRVDELLAAGAPGEALRAWGRAAGNGGVLGLAVAGGVLHAAEYAGVSAFGGGARAALVPELAGVQAPRAIASAGGDVLVVADGGPSSTLVRLDVGTRAGDVLATQGVLAGGDVDDLRGVAALAAGPAGTLFALDVQGDGPRSGRAWALEAAAAAEWPGDVRAGSAVALTSARHAGAGLTAPRAIHYDAGADRIFVADAARGLCRMEPSGGAAPAFAIDSSPCVPGSPDLIAPGLLPVGLVVEESLWVHDGAAVTRYRVERAGSVPSLVPADVFAAAAVSALAAGPDAWLYLAEPGSGSIARLDPRTGARDACAISVPGAHDVRALATLVRFAPTAAAPGDGTLYAATDVGLFAARFSDLRDACYAGAAVLAEVTLGGAPAEPGGAAAVAVAVEDNVTGAATVLVARDVGERAEIDRLRVGAVAVASSVERWAGTGVFLDPATTPLAETALRTVRALSYVPRRLASAGSSEGLWLADDPLFDAARGGPTGLGRLWRVPSAAPARIVSPADRSATAAATLTVEAELPAGFDDALLYDASTVWAPAAVDAGRARFEVPVAGDGPHAYAVVAFAAATQDDAAVSPVVRVLADRVAPAAPRLAAPDVAPASSFVVRGETEPGATVEVRLVGADGAVAAGPWAVQAGPTGYFEATVPAGAAGAYTLRALPTDLGGNSGPDAARPLRRGAAAAGFTLSGLGAWATARTVPLRGDVEAGARLRFSLDGAAPVVAGPFLAGSWSWDLAVPAEGPHALAVTVVDANGVESAAAPLAFVADWTAPGAPVLDALPAATAAATLQVAGRAEPGATVQLLVDGALAGSAVADASTGAFAISLSLRDGSHAVSARAVDPAGNAGPATAAATVVVDRAPVTPPVITAPRSGTVMRVRDITVTGRAGAGAKVFVAVDGAAAGEAVADAAGGWTLPLRLRWGTHRLSAEVRDASGLNAVQAEVAFTLEEDRKSGCATGGGEALSLLALAALALRARRRR